MGRLSRYWIVMALLLVAVLSGCDQDKPDVLDVTEATPAGEIVVIGEETPEPGDSVAPTEVLPTIAEPEIAAPTASGDATQGSFGQSEEVATAAPGSEPATPASGETPDAAIPTAAPEETTVAVTEPPTASVEATPTGEVGSAGTDGGAQPVQPTASAASSTSIYVVKAGDTLFSIASAYGTTLDQLRALNPAININYIFVGQEITVPTTTTTSAPPAASGGQTIHTVQQGEWLYGIARQYGVSVQAIQAANPTVNLNTVYPGQQIIIPTGG